MKGHIASGKPRNKQNRIFPTPCGELTWQWWMIEHPSGLKAEVSRLNPPGRIWPRLPHGPLIHVPFAQGVVVVVRVFHPRLWHLSSPKAGSCCTLLASSGVTRHGFPQLPSPHVVHELIDEAHPCPSLIIEYPCPCRGAQAAEIALRTSFLAKWSPGFVTIPHWKHYAHMKCQQAPYCPTHLLGSSFKHPSSSFKSSRWYSVWFRATSPPFTLAPLGFKRLK